MQGLQNLGSTCAINSLIQIICRTKHLREALLEESVPDNTISLELKEILHLMHNTNNSLSPKRFIKSLYRFFDGIFTQGEQLDIGELWIFLFDKIQTELATVPVCNDTYAHKILYTDDSTTNREIANNKDLAVKYSDTMRKINNEKSSRWLATSQGVMLNIIECKRCKNCFHNFEPFTSIPIVIGEEDGAKTVSSMFRSYLEQQKCSGDWRCDTCNEATEYTKTMKIWRLPPVLIFVVQRFINFQKKNTSPININKSLCIKAGSVISNMGEDTTYRCTSVAMHYGNLQGGHYCAICKVDDKLLLYDDLNITMLDDKQHNIFEKNKDAYMIVYSQD